jgi:hypothetical protein
MNRSLSELNMPIYDRRKDNVPKGLLDAIGHFLAQFNAPIVHGPKYPFYLKVGIYLFLDKVYYL